jgi:hypothetical protein
MDASQANAAATDAANAAAIQEAIASAEEKSTKYKAGPVNGIAGIGIAGSNDSKWESNISLRYPNDIISAESDYMYFEFFNYQPPFQSGSATSSGKIDAYNSSNTNAKVASDLPKIMLYMPEGVTTSYKADWTGKKFSNIAAGLLASGKSLSEGDFKTAISAATATAGGAFGRFGDEASAKAINSLISSVTGDSLSRNDIFSATGGAILNPNAELIFGGHDLRTLKIKFLMVPYSEIEAAHVDQITRAFKRAMLPKYQTSSSGFFNSQEGGENSDTAQSQGNHGWIGLPNQCKFTFMQGNKAHPYISQYKMCAITDVDISYTPDGVYASTYAGYPVATQLELTFMETKLVYAEDIAVRGASF